MDINKYFTHNNFFLDNFCFNLCVTEKWKKRRDPEDHKEF